jgi:hypothetical protein
MAARRRRSIVQTRDLLTVMGRLMVLWCVFLFVLEGVDWLGVTKASLRLLDEVAMAATAALLLAATLGVGAAVRFIDRHRAPREGERPC